MKKIFTLMGVLAFVGTGFAQENNEGLYAEYQLPNPDFEEGWTYNEIKSSFGTGVTYSEETPNCWNSFYTAVGEYAPLAWNLWQTRQVLLRLQPDMTEPDMLR